MQTLIKVGVIYGSTRPGRFCDRVARWVGERVEAAGDFEVLAIDPLDTTLADLDALRARIAEADCFIIVTPEYNHSYPAPLKALIDSVSAEWHAKPVAFVSYGGGSGGLRAIEHLRAVFAELHAVGLRDSLSFPFAWEQFDAVGRLREPARAERTMTILLERLLWWAEALRAARLTTPYSEAA
ncbi:NADPH-dependent FMN reductase [Sphingosinicella sp. BN140058]|uniref:NADPH-dependent FMN reductase n=1 Tax=Sphingosinicella sp. BN140058 TaxID=1892855 RepID=UPI00101228F4|nr:NAD(P)H-dependent oxidoreductase [Sphingosinicella sp. BN140058]QAY76026.1 NADPH-dependent oxidoreductase [Sphingosinicella sp. BN140058]